MKEILNGIMNLSSKRLQDARQILKLTQKIKSHIEKKEVQALNQTIALRQRWMKQEEDTRKKIQEKMEELRGQYAIKSVEEINQGEYCQVKVILDNRVKIKNIYSIAYQLDQENIKNAEELLEEYKCKIKGLHQGKKAFHAYGKKPSMPSIMINKLK